VKIKQTGDDGGPLAIGRGDTTPDIGTEVEGNVENAEQALATLQQRGATVKEPIAHMPFGQVFSIEGPGGYVLYLLQLA